MRKAGRTTKREGKRLRVSFRVPGTPLKAQTMRFPLGATQRDINSAISERVKALQARYRFEFGERRDFAADVTRYLDLPDVRRLATFSEREMQVRAFADHFGSRDRFSITKQEIETQLGRWQRQRKWEPGTFNKWLTALKSFYNELEAPDGTSPNPCPQDRVSS